jgi:hypothetical protein
MADADQQGITSPDTTQSQAGVTKSELDAKLGEIQLQLQAMNSTFQESVQSIASAVAPKQLQQQRIITDDDLYDSRKLESKVQAQASQIAQQFVQRERELNSMTYNLAQDYPEIQTDPALQKLVKEILNTLPSGMQDTAQGLEMAVLKATSKAGLVPKSKRGDSSLDPDVSASGARGSSQSRRAAKQGKVSEDTLEIAALMGVNINDPETVKRIEGYSKREDWLKYR